MQGVFGVLVFSREDIGILPPPHCEDRVRDGPASGKKGSKGRNYLDCIRGNGLHLPEEILSLNRITDSSRGYMYACTALR